MIFDSPMTTAISASGLLDQFDEVGDVLGDLRVGPAGVGPGGRPGTSPVESRRSSIILGLRSGRLTLAGYRLDRDHPGNGLAGSGRWQ